MPDKKLIFLSACLIVINGCNVSAPPVKPIENASFITSQPKDISKQGPNSTGGLFRINYKDGTSAALRNFKVLSQENNQATEIGSGKTNDQGEAFLPENVITEELIKLLKENKISLLIKVLIDDKEIQADIKNIDYQSEKLISVTAEVEAPVPVELRLSQKTVNITTMKSSDVTAEVLMSDGTKNSNVTWASSDETVAKVNNGRISGLKKGVTIITVSAVAGLNIQNKITVTVDDDIRVQSVKVTDPATKTILEKIILKKNENRQLEAQAVLSDGSVSGNVIWKSSDDSKVVVGKNSGLATGTGKGNATITATSTEDLNKSATIEVIIEE
jgi:hypothetical protein